MCKVSFDVHKCSLIVAHTTVWAHEMRDHDKMEICDDTSAIAFAQNEKVARKYLWMGNVRKQCAKEIVVFHVVLFACVSFLFIHFASYKEATNKILNRIFLDCALFFIYIHFGDLKNRPWYKQFLCLLC